MLRHYEGMFVLHNRESAREEGDPEPPTAEEVVRALLEKVGASVACTVPWANRKLAYPIRGNQTGSFVLAYFSAEPEAGSRLGREVAIHERLLRHMTIKLEALPDAEKVPGPLTDPASRAPVPASERADKAEEAEKATEGAPEGPPGSPETAAKRERRPESSERREAKALDYKNVYFLRRMVTPQGKIYSRVRSGMDSKHQHRLRRAIIRARVLALLPFIGR